VLERHGIDSHALLLRAADLFSKGWQPARVARELEKLGLNPAEAEDLAASLYRDYRSAQRGQGYWELFGAGATLAGVLALMWILNQLWNDPRRYIIPIGGLFAAAFLFLRALAKLF
jgi:hypothetical protein